MVRLPKNGPPVTPGEFLIEILEDLEMSQSEFARLTKMPFQRVNDIIHARRMVTASSALRFAKVLGNTAGFWLNAQMAVDLYEAKQKEAAVLDGLDMYASP